MKHHREAAPFTQLASPVGCRAQRFRAREKIRTLFQRRNVPYYTTGQHHSMLCVSYIMGRGVREQCSKWRTSPRHGAKMKLDTIRSHEGCASFSQNEGRTNFARERECETSAGWYNKLKIEEK